MPWIALLGVYVTWFACEYIQTYSPGLSLAIHVARFEGSAKDPPSTSEESARSRARRVTQSDPCGLEPLQVRATLDSIFRCPHLCKEPYMVIIY